MDDSDFIKYTTELDNELKTMLEANTVFIELGSQDWNDGAPIRRFHHIHQSVYTMFVDNLHLDTDESPIPKWLTDPLLFGRKMELLYNMVILIIKESSTLYDGYKFKEYIRFMWVRLYSVVFSGYLNTISELIKIFFELCALHPYTRSSRSSSSPNTNTFHNNDLLLEEADDDVAGYDDPRYYQLLVELVKVDSDIFIYLSKNIKQLSQLIYLYMPGTCLYDIIIDNVFNDMDGMIMLQFLASENILKPSDILESSIKYEIYCWMYKHFPTVNSWHLGIWYNIKYLITG
jgi:hypothetical protein